MNVGSIGIVLVVVLVVATILLMPTVYGLRRMYTHGKEKNHYLYTWSSLVERCG